MTVDAVEATVAITETRWIEPETLALAIGDLPGFAWLDGAADDERSRISYICPVPIRSVVARDGAVRIDGVPVDTTPLGALRAVLGPRRDVPAAPFAFRGGVVAMLGYGLGQALVGQGSRHDDPHRLPDLLAHVHAEFVAFDRAARRCWLVSPDPGRFAARIASWLDAPSPPGPVPRARFVPEFGRASHLARVREIRARIAAGEIFQANLTRRETAPRAPGTRAVDVQAALRARSPSPFGAALVGHDGFALCGVSPERFLVVSADGHVQTRPIKGTAPRGHDARDDDRRAGLLAASAKDRAEHLMIVDLMRNDLSRVCATGSVVVPQLQAVERFASVLHMVSAVEGRLRPGFDAVDLLAATLPGGSVTGAPKIRAMSIIDELEASRRGPYCGAVAWLGHDGAMDSCIVIRGVTLTDRHLIAAAGGAITWDSDPDEEWHETELKLAPIRAALA